MSDYCVTPPFIVGGVTPNLLMLIDNSASMYDLAYIAGSTSATLPTYSCGGTVGDTQISFCFDTTYNNSYSYAGYFDKDKYYRYNETPADNASTPGSNDKFTEISPFPTTCTYGSGTGYLCVNVSSGAITGFAASGRFLNWLSASKFDVEKKILTGGKYDSASQILKSESRGCVGKRFVKVVPGIPLTFAVRGPNAVEPDFTNPGTQGGENRIEIYTAVNPNMDDCQCAVANWTSGNFGQAQTLTNECFNIGTSTAARHELATFNHTQQTCWYLADNIKKGATTEAAIWQGVNLQDLKNDCAAAYDDAYTVKNKPALADIIPNPGYITSLFTNVTSGNYICTGASSATHNSVASPYDVLGNDTTGFLGRCLNAFGVSPSGLATNWFADDTCFKREMLHYCFGSQVAGVTDPSEGAADSSQTGNVPAIVMDSSVRSLGNPAGTFFARVGVSSPPAGLINTFGSQIRFGAMSFNVDGSKTECNPGGVSGSNIKCAAYCSTTTSRVCSSSADCPGGETCNLIPKTDGGKILSYIGDSLGDHSSGLINTIDNITASSWTPFAEAFYSAIGYYARTNDYSVSTGTSRDFRSQTDDYQLDRNPSQYRCQRNNILLITDGASTADVSTTPNYVASLYHPSYLGYETGYDSTNTCPDFAGSRSLDDLAWIAKNRDIKTFSTSTASTAAPASASEAIDTYVVYSGPLTSAQPGQCNPKTLMDATASAGGTNAALTASDPAQLEAAIRSAF
ncbi:MAG: pilus assembly protein PilY, partial [Nitrospirota bacterium]|nr:pilus assembly protein PilY [Nitrospirota bacterium]